MLPKLYSIYDVKAQIYLHPRVYLNTPHAIRSIACEHTNPDSIINRYPNDFQLVELGEWDDKFASIDLLPKPNVVANLHEILRMDEKERNVNDNDRTTERDATRPASA